jgi:dihydroorotase
MDQIIFDELPFDAHLHVRDGKRLESVVPHTGQQFGRAIIMPNLSLPVEGQPPEVTKHVTTVAEVETYREKILAAVPQGLTFEPLMTVSLSGHMTPDDLEKAVRNEHVIGAKYYAGHTTNSEGVSDAKTKATFFEILAHYGKTVMLHGEGAGRIQLRENVFYDGDGPWIRRTFPDLRIVCEHITTRRAVNFVMASENTAATITPQHLLCNFEHLFAGGIRPHYYCMPILKSEEDRQALLHAATSGSSKFFLGTDSAPHPVNGKPGKAKETSCGCAGCYTAPHALELYAEAYASVNALEKLPDFACRFGREFYELSPLPGRVIIAQEKWELPERYAFGGDEVVPFRQEMPLQWKASRN